MLLGYSRTVYFFPFVVFGYCPGKDGIIPKTGGLYRTIALCVMALVLFTMLIYNQPVTLLYGSSAYQATSMPNVLDALIRTTYLLASLSMVIGFLYLVPRGRVNWLARTGQASLAIYLLHALLLKESLRLGLYDQTIIDPTVYVPILTVGTVLMLQTKPARQLANLIAFEHSRAKLR